MANEPFSFKKWLGGFVNPTTWSKSIVYFAMIAVILIVIFTIYRAYFMKTGSNIAKPFVIALPGSTIGDITQHSEQKIEQKRKWWQPIPYIAIYGGARGTSKTSFDTIEGEYGVQGGIRWDFN